MGDLNPRRVAPYTLSKRAPSATRRILRRVAYRRFAVAASCRPLGPNRPEQSRGRLNLVPDPPCGVYLANPPRAGMQQGYAGSDGCAGGPHSLPPVRRPAASFPRLVGDVSRGAAPPDPPMW